MKFFSLLDKKGYIKENKKLIMNLKERGITVGDLLILLIIIIITSILVKSFKEDKKTTLIYIDQEKVFYNEYSLSKLI